MEREKKDRLKRFIDCYVPVTTCNLRCSYCYVTQQRKFDDKIPIFEYSPGQVALALSKERLGGTCCINLCAGGETLLPSVMVDYAKAILEQGHYLMIVTNGTINKRFDEIIKFPQELLNRLFFKFSFHYLELKRLKVLNNFFENIDKIRNAGCSFTLELTPNDELMPYIDELKETCQEKVGALCHVTVARDNTKKNLPILKSCSTKEYSDFWSTFQSKLFEYKMSTFNIKRKEFCYAGDWTGFLHLGTGNLQQCYRGKILQNIFENPDQPIKFIAIGNNCREAHCYNSHVWLTFGAIPELEAPTYATMRNRVCIDGKEWLKDNMKDFFNNKLKNTNNEYSEKENREANQFSKQM